MGKNAPLALTRDDQTFRTRLRHAAALKPNFARHYILTAWGCGAECLAGALIDANTGKAYWFPFTICCWTETDDKFRPIDYRIDSTMIIFSGSRNEADEQGVHYYSVEKGKFILIKSTVEPKNAR